MVGNNDKQLRFVVVLNFIYFISTLWMISQQHQVTYWNMESFVTYSHSSAAHVGYSAEHIVWLMLFHCNWLAQPSITN